MSAPTCVTCKHHVQVASHHSCRMGTDIVTGDNLSCRIMRAETGTCGPEGKQWEQRQNAAVYSESPALSALVEATEKNEDRARRLSAIETPMATIRRENDPEVMRKVGRKPRDDYKPDTGGDAA